MNYEDFSDVRSRSSRSARKNKNRKKVAKDIGKGGAQGMTAYRMQYRSHDIKRDQNWKRSDNIFFGTKFTDQTNYKSQFKGAEDAKKINEDFHLNKKLLAKNKDANFYDSWQSSINYPKQRALSHANIKATTWKKDKWYGDKTPLDSNSVYKKYFQGYYDQKDFAKKPLKRLDTIAHTHENIRPMRSTSYNRYYKEKERSYDTDKGIRQLNRDYDKTTEQMKPCHRVEQYTENRIQFNPRNAQINSKVHTGKDKKVMNELLQLMNNYQFVDEI
jgi:hypothetical protein